MTKLIPLSAAVQARLDAGRISAAFDEFLGTIGLQRAVARLAADTAGRLDHEAFVAVVKSLIGSYRWELPAASDAWWAAFGDAFAAAFAGYRTANAWTDRDACSTEAARVEQAAVRRVGEGTRLPRNLLVECCLLLGNRAGWRRFKKFAQAEQCGLNAAFDRWYPCSRGRFLIDDATSRQVLGLVLDAIEAAPDEASVYALLEVVERFPTNGEAILARLAAGDGSSPFEAQFVKAAGVPEAGGPLARLAAAALCAEQKHFAAPQREAFSRMCRAAGLFA